MDRTVKILLGMIAASLFMLNLQLAGVSLVSEANAYGGDSNVTISFLGSEFEGIASSIDRVAKAIERHD